ncbi:MAG: hypothetical protein MK200_03210, partial [Nitrosopumilus sp.]|nr:hypothetical protein [Nitrosopumilus sp.]
EDQEINNEQKNLKKIRMNCQMIHQDPYDSIQMEDNSMIETEDGEAILLEVQDNVGTAAGILFETGSQDADGVLKIRVNGEDKYIQLYNVVS